MTEFQNKLENWFIEMGFPLDEAKNTDWKTICCGRLPEYWKEVMSVIKSKHEVKNIKKNIMLNEIKKYEQIKETSAAKIGNILPPPQIYYPAQKDIYLKNIDNAIIENFERQCSHMINMDKKKRKCYELYKIGEEIMNIENKIYLMNELSKKLNNDIKEYKNKSKEALKLKEYFINSPNENCKSNTNNYDNMEIKFQNVVFQNNSNYNKQTLNNEPTEKIDRDFFIKNIQTLDVYNLILNYQKKMPDLLNQYILQVPWNDYQKKKNKSISGECLSLSKGIIKMQIFHCQLVVASMQFKVDSEKAKTAISILKSKVHSSISSDKCQIIENESNNVYYNAYNKVIDQELEDIMIGNGFYSKLSNILRVENITKNINIYKTKKQYLNSYVKLGNKIKEIYSFIDKIHEINGNIKQYLLESQKNRIDKILWDPNFKEIQDIYLNVIMKIPSILKCVNDDLLESFNYLSIIIHEYNFGEKFIENSNLFEKEKNIFLHIFKDPCLQLISIQNAENLFTNEDNNLIPFEWLHIEYLQSIFNVFYMFIRKLKFKHSLDNVHDIHIRRNPSCNRIEQILGNYLDNNYLIKYENESLKQSSIYLKKQSMFSKVDGIITEFNEIYNFFNKFVNEKKENCSLEL